MESVKFKYKMTKSTNNRCNNYLDMEDFVKAMLNHETN